MEKKLAAFVFVFFLLTSLLFFLSCKNNDKPPDGPTPPSVVNPPVLSYSIIASLPHDTGSYTQGLCFYKGELFESAGMYEKSRLRRTDLKSGKVLQEIKLDNKYFAEGICILRDTIYQLTWRENTVFVYTVKDFKKVNEFRIDTEGWGITHDGKNLIVSNGSGDLYYYDPANFRLLTKMAVMEGNNQTYNLNELEYIDGYVYANQYQYAYILKIDPVVGKVEAKYDVNDIWKRVQVMKPDADVPNGIAFDEITKKVYVTGKLWPELYEIKFSQ